MYVQHNTVQEIYTTLYKMYVPATQHSTRSIYNTVLNVCTAQHNTQIYNTVQNECTAQHSTALNKIMYDSNDVK